MGMDIGPKTVALFENELRNAKMVLWNGPVGVFEWKQFSEGTASIAKMVAKTKRNDNYWRRRFGGRSQQIWPCRSNVPRINWRWSLARISGRQATARR